MRPPAYERRPVPGAPRLSQASGQLLRRIEVVDEYDEERSIEVPVERPLTIRVDAAPVGTLWTLGASPECLVLGYLWNQRLVSNVAALESIVIDWAEGTASVTTRSGRGPESNGPADQLLDVKGRIGTEQDGLITHQDVLAGAALEPARISRTTLLSILKGVTARGGGVSGRGLSPWVRVVAGRSSG